MKGYNVTMISGGTVRLGADRYTADGKVRFYLGNILHAEFPTEDVSAITEEQEEATKPALVIADVVLFGGHRS